MTGICSTTLPTTVIRTVGRYHVSSTSSLLPQSLRQLISTQLRLRWSRALL